MGRLGKHLKAEIDKYIEQVIETRLNFKQTALTFAPSGDDSPPLENDRIALISIDGNGKFAAIGTLTVSQGAKPGEKIIFSRNSGGEVQAVISLLNDGTIKLQATKDTEIKTDGKINLDGKTELTLKAAKTKITGGQLECNGTATPSGSGPFCAVPVCPMTGAPHCGTVVVGT